MADEVQPIVIDNGSGMIKSGFGGDEAPRSVFPAIIGRPKYPPIIQSSTDLYIGDQACSMASVFMLKYPIEHGIVTNWDDMEKIWHHTFYNELHVNPSEHPVLLTETKLNPKSNSEKMIQVMFETFNVPSLFISTQNILSMISSGKNTGVFVELGDGTFSVLPILEKNFIPEAIMCCRIGGRDVTSFLKDKLYDRGYMYETSEEFDIIRDIKEKLSFVSLDYEEDLKKAKSSSEYNAEYKLPDEQIIGIASERFECTELLFKPSMNGFEFNGIDSSIFNSINKCDDKIKKDLFANIVLSGGTSLIKGLPQRIAKKLENLVSKKDVNVVTHPVALYAAWIGGSIFSSQATFQQLVIGHDQYKEEGTGILRKCYI